MSAGKDLLAEAAVRACTFDFSGAEELCRRVLALDDDPRAGALLNAIAHNRTSCLYSLAATGIQVFNRTQLFTLNGESGQSVRIQLNAHHDFYRRYR